MEKFVIARLILVLIPSCGIIVGNGDDILNEVNHDQ